MLGGGALIVRVKLFASYKEKAGTSDIKMRLPEGALVRDAACELLRLHPSIAGETARLMIAVNEEYQEHDFPLSENDEVAFIPPVSGGRC